MATVSQPNRQDRLVYTVPDVAALLGLSQDKVYGLVRANKIPHKRLGRRIIIPYQPFHDWLNSPQRWASADGGG